MFAAWFELNFYWLFGAIVLCYGWSFGSSSGDELFGYGDEESVLSREVSHGGEVFKNENNGFLNYYFASS